MKHLFKVQAGRLTAQIYQRKVFLLSSLLMSLSVLCMSSISQAAIYGIDDRIEVERSPQRIQKLAESVLMMIPKNAVLEKGDSVDLDVLPLSHTQSWNVCSENPHAAQPSIQPACTGFLIAPDLLVTAGHCMIWMDKLQETSPQSPVTTPFCTDFVWLMDYRTQNGKTQVTGLKKDKVVGCKNVIYAQSHEIFPGQFQIDAALIRLDRALTDRAPLKLARSSQLVVSESVSMIGHPSGLPQKWAARGKVLDRSESQFFRTTLDSMNGNSGSPVLNSRDEVVGILVRGYPEDYRYDDQKQCRVLNRCDSDAKKCSEESSLDRPGEHAQRIEILKPFIQQFGL